MVSKFLSLWNKYSRYGIEGHAPRFAKRIVLANQIGMTLGFISAAFLVAWYLKGQMLMVWLNLFFVVSHLCTPLMNRRGYVNFTRFMLIYCLSTFIFIVAGMMGEGPGLHLVYYNIAAVSCILFGTKELKKTVIAFSYPAILFGILLATDYKVFPNIIGTTEGFPTFNHLCNFVFISLATIYLYRSMERAEGEYKELYEKHIEAQRLLDQERGRAIYSMKMAAVGEMAGSIAHEINSPLNVITILSEQMIKRVPTEVMSKEKIVESVTKINATANRIADIVVSLRSFSRNTDGLPYCDTDVRNIIHETLVLCKERFRSKDIQLNFIIPDEINTVYCRQIEISQVLLNLLNNACDALEGFPEPTIEISITNQIDKVIIGVADNGPGIEPAIHEKIFSPFFTTKEIGKGTGLGLSISKGLIEANKGSLYLDQSVAFTKFVIELATSPNKRTMA